MIRTSGYVSAVCALIVIASATICHSQSAGDKGWAILESAVQQTKVLKTG